MNKVANLPATNGGQGLPVCSAEPACFDTDAHVRVLQRIDQMGDQYSAMSGSELAFWIDCLPRADFLEYMMLSGPIRDR
jgi:hypothetical protein